MVLYKVLPAVVLVLYGFRKLCERSWGKCRNNVKLDGKVALVTGANSGIGLEVAKELAARGCTVILACRSMEKASQTAALIRQTVTDRPTTTLIPMQLDLSSFKSIKQLCNDILNDCSHIDLLINNAGVSCPVQKTQDGFEMNWGVNYLGPFYLTLHLLPVLSKNSRIVIVSSSLMEKGKLEYYLKNTNDVLGESLYADSKLACTYFGLELARRHRGDTSVFIVCPGWVYTNLFRHSLKWYHYILVAPVALFFMRSAKSGSETIIYCATEPGLEGQCGSIFRDCKLYVPRMHFQEDIAKILWKNSLELIAEHSF